MKNWSIKLILLIAISLTGHRTSYAGEKWERVSTAKYTLNNKQDAITFADDKNGWYGNGTGKIYKTSNGGKNWKVVWAHSGTYIRALEFANTSLGVLGNVGPGYFPNVSDRQPLYVTHDGGTHWNAVQPTSGRQIVGVCAIDVLKVEGKIAAIRAGGRVGGPAGMLESFDEGRTFRARDMSSVTGMILDIHFVNERIGFIAGATEPVEEKAHARILKTTDGGESWRAVFESDRSGDNNWKIAFPSPRVGYATIISYQAPDDEARGYVVKTEDGGEHWQRQTVTNNRDWIPYGINFIDESRGWVGGSSGGFETADGGASWTPSEMGLSVNKIRFVRRQDNTIAAFAIGKDLYELDVKR